MNTVANADSQNTLTWDKIQKAMEPFQVPPGVKMVRDARRVEVKLAHHLPDPKELLFMKAEQVHGVVTLPDQAGLLYVICHPDQEATARDFIKQCREPALGGIRL